MACLLCVCVCLCGFYSALLVCSCDGFLLHWFDGVSQSLHGEIWWRLLCW